MPSSLIPYASGLASGLDDLSSPEASPSFVNALVGPGGEVRQRPGITTYQTSDGVDSEVVAIAPIPALDYIFYVTADRKLWVLAAPDAPPIALSDDTAATQLDGTARPIIVVTSVGVIVTGGGLPQKSYTLGLSSRLGGTPPKASHVAELALRLVVNKADRSAQFYWSGSAEGVPGVGNYESWQATSYTTAEAKPDPVIALWDNIRELWCFGERTVQIYAVSEDPLLPFRTVTVLGQGLAPAAYSVIQTDDTFAWLDSNRRFVSSDGRNMDVLSTPQIQKTINALTTIADCWGFRTRIDSFDCLVWVFPTEQTAFCWEMNGKKWSTWRGFDAGASDGYAGFAATAYAYWPEKNLHLVGTSDGKIAQLSMDVSTDLGNPIRIEDRTGFSNEGTDALKAARRTMYTVRRGVVPFGSDDEYVEIRHRDDLGKWSDWRRHGLGNQGDYDTTLYDYEGGLYRKRQRHLRYSGSSPFTLIRAEHTFELGRH